MRMALSTPPLRQTIVSHFRPFPADAGRNITEWNALNDEMFSPAKAAKGECR